jgi:beta-glucuronidase
VNSRREFIARGCQLAAVASLDVSALAVLPEAAAADACGARVPLTGVWQFRFDPDRTGETNGWHASTAGSGWSSVHVPHTWQIAKDSAEYFGTAWYNRTFQAPAEWKDRSVRVEFEAVYHSATVWVNGHEAGKHLRKGYTAFTLDITPYVEYGAPNSIVVRVDNSFDQAMLPRGRSFDWTPDGGIYRPVSLLISSKVFIARVDVDAVPDIAAGTALISISVSLENSGNSPWAGSIGFHITDEQTGRSVFERKAAVYTRLAPRKEKILTLPAATLHEAKLWHFDHPNLYRLQVVLSQHELDFHALETTFGARSIEIKNTGFYLNGERVWLAGVERMAGSNPDFGMAEPAEWLSHDHDDLKQLNCVFTRVHWHQDRRVLDYCDRHGILIQTEVPTWGPDTFKGMGNTPAPEIMENGIEQLREMIARDRNHPCIFSWGLCNEINGQNPPAYEFAKGMLEEAKKLDPRRLCSYASNSLQSNASRDVSRLMDFVEWNEYYESWYGGTPSNLRSNVEQIHEAFPGKPIVISEYGYCACTPERPEGDSRRIEVLLEHNRVFREKEYVGGLIFFCYNDYRTHIGDKGAGVMKQRVHGVVDLYGARKPSWAVLRYESSPIESMAVERSGKEFTIRVRARKTAPAYTLDGYVLQTVLYGYSEIPLERYEVPLPRLAPGDEAKVAIQWKENEPVRVAFDVQRPTGFSAFTKIWTP